MPIEYQMLKDRPSPRNRCPFCGAAPFVPFLRGMIQRPRRRFWFGRTRPYCALICSECKEIVSYEDPFHQ